MQNLLVGITLIIIAIGWLKVCIPRGGKKAWFIRKPFLEPAVPILMIGIFAVGLILIIDHLTTIDEFDFSGPVGGS